MVKGSIAWEHNAEDGLVIRLKPGLSGLFAGEVRQHTVAARKEVLLALRSLIDIAVQQTEEKEGKVKKSVAKIKVE
jgi:hypothetical protein